MKENTFLGNSMDKFVIRSIIKGYKNVMYRSFSNMRIIQGQNY